MKFNEGDVISAIVLIKSVTNAKAKNGNDYLKLEINDGQIDISAFVWDKIDFNFIEGEVIKIKGKFSTYAGKPKIDVTSASKTTEKLKLKTISDEEYIDYLSRFKKLLEVVSDNDFKMLLSSLFDDENVYEMFIKAPAAKSNHQAYIGGLLQHSVEIAELAYIIYLHDTKNVNLSLLISGALLHDIGKIKEYEYEDKIDRTTIGKLIGHTSLALLIIDKFVQDDMPKKKYMELIHLILSHHGKREWGAPVEPMMKEAIILHQCDMINSYGSRFDEMKECSKNEFSQFDETYKRNWYLNSTIE